jgi:hypothetical protein
MDPKSIDDSNYKPCKFMQIMPYSLLNGTTIKSNKIIFIIFDADADVN